MASATVEMAGGEMLSLVRHSLELGELTLAGRSEKHRKQGGQFLTPAPVAHFMARQLGPIQAASRVLDPAIGSGVLACAVIERAIAEGQPQELFIEGHEIDPELCQSAREALAWATQRAAEAGLVVHTRIHERDFVLNHVPTTQLNLFSQNLVSSDLSLYDYIIANPPYFKLNKKDPRVKAVLGQIKGHTNIYTLFMALAGRLLKPQGRACFIVPRSFCSGAYFAGFRQDFIKQVVPLAVHLFESRQDTFKRDAVLQENVIIAFHRRRPEQVQQPSSLVISTSKGPFELDAGPVARRVSMKHFVGRRNGSLFFRLPTGELDEQIVETIGRWGGSLADYGLSVSTGPVVAFRARSFLTTAEAVRQGQAAPLLWMQNVLPQRVEWPVTRGKKPQGVSLQEGSVPLLVSKANYVLLRRFSAKEEPRRLIAAPLLADEFIGAWVGLENHLNYIYRKQGVLETEEAYGLSGLLNSALVDRYVRIANGNTQVNAAELRALPLPPLEIIKQIGRQLLIAQEANASADVDSMVFSTLRASGCLPPDFPTIKETRKC
ncbi:MAG: N-6 DNA methylase [Anaerolineae bacterium]|jgi:adenine-specific DNA-methyltransferase